MCSIHACGQSVGNRCGRTSTDVRGQAPIRVDSCCRCWCTQKSMARVWPLASDERADMLSLAERMQRVVASSWSLTDSPESCTGYRGGLNGVWHPIASLDSVMACGAVPTEVDA